EQRSRCGDSEAEAEEHPLKMQEKRKGSADLSLKDINNVENLIAEYIVGMPLEEPMIRSNVASGLELKRMDYTDEFQTDEIFNSHEALVH
ncbi:hypothetical protein Dimus_003328, partial [Dionaea muscipula]